MHNTQQPEQPPILHYRFLPSNSETSTATGHNFKAKYKNRNPEILRQKANITAMKVIERKVTKYRLFSANDIQMYSFSTCQQRNYANVQELL